MRRDGLASGCSVRSAPKASRRPSLLPCRSCHFFWQPDYLRAEHEYLSAEAEPLQLALPDQLVDELWRAGVERSRFAATHVSVARRSRVDLFQNGFWILAALGSHGTTP